MRIVPIVLVGLFVIAVFSGRDPAVVADGADPSVGPAAVSADSGQRAQPVIGTAVLPAPSTSRLLKITLTNLSANSTIGPHQFEAVILDCFPADRRRALTIDETEVTDPPGGTSEVTTGNDDDDVGPTVVVFTGFDDGESVLITVEAERWDDDDFDPRRRDMVACRVEAVFFPFQQGQRIRAGILRGDGSMRHEGDDTVTAFIRQRHP